MGKLSPIVLYYNFYLWLSVTTSVSIHYFRKEVIVEAFFPYFLVIVTLIFGSVYADVSSDYLEY